ncbi:anti-sigma factor antagonist [Streptomyces sp. NPDC059070]|uniref:anti-sigma factor antagonist n=1 Tax=unclassified Streptomyces TaxID=2593676 RepID=UPI0034E24FAA
MHSEEHIDDSRKLLPSPRHRAERPFLRVRAVRGVTVVELRGEIDIHAVQLLQPRLDVLTAQGLPGLAVDLRRITFLDCSGLALLVRTHRRVTGRGSPWGLVCEDPFTLRIIRITGLTGLLGPAPTLERALDGFSLAHRSATAAE